MALLGRREVSLAAAILVFAAVLGLAAPGFFTFGNLRDVAITNMPVLLVALGMTLVILTGQIDISVGSQFAICSVAAGVFAKMGLPIAVAGALACLTGAALGAINGALVAWVRIPSIIVTLAMMVALRDGLRWATEGAWVQDLPPDFRSFGWPPAAGEAFTIGFAAVVTVTIGWSLHRIAAGRAVYATGSDREAARIAGIDPARVIFGVFLLTGALAGCAALFNAVRFSQIPSNAGLGLELQVIAAVIVGGTAITGGRGSVAGTCLGVVLLGMIGPALTFLGLSAHWERAIQGAIILTAVAVDSIRMRAGKHAGSLAAQRV